MYLLTKYAASLITCFPLTPKMAGTVITQRKIEDLIPVWPRWLSSSNSFSLRYLRVTAITSTKKNSLPSTASILAARWTPYNNGLQLLLLLLVQHSFSIVLYLLLHRCKLDSFKVDVALIFVPPQELVVPLSEMTKRIHFVLEVLRYPLRNSDALLSAWGLSFLLLKVSCAFPLVFALAELAHGAHRFRFSHLQQHCIGNSSVSAVQSHYRRAWITSCLERQGTVRCSEVDRRYVGIRGNWLVLTDSGHLGKRLRWNITRRGIDGPLTGRWITPGPREGFTHVQAMVVGYKEREVTLEGWECTESRSAYT